MELAVRIYTMTEGKAADRDDLIYLQKLPLFQKTSEGEYEAIL